MKKMNIYFIIIIDISYHNSHESLPQEEIEVSDRLLLLQEHWKFRLKLFENFDWQL